jgi:hypothetical protein
MSRLVIYYRKFNTVTNWPCQAKKQRKKHTESLRRSHHGEKQLNLRDVNNILREDMPFNHVPQTPFFIDATVIGGTAIYTLWMKKILTNDYLFTIVKIGDSDRPPCQANKPQRGALWIWD